MMYRPIKRILDIVLSLAGLAVLWLPMLIIALAVKLDSPGPALFKQKRVGIHKNYFEILKFRTMRTDTPHDAPTHQLQGAASYITKVGETVAICEKSSGNDKIKAIVEANASRPVVKWLDRQALEAKIIAFPAREDIDLEVQETLIVELYSK